MITLNVSNELSILLSTNFKIRFASAEFDFQFQYILAHVVVPYLTFHAVAKDFLSANVSILFLGVISSSIHDDPFHFFRFQLIGAHS